MIKKRNKIYKKCKVQIRVEYPCKWSPIKVYVCCSLITLQ